MFRRTGRVASTRCSRHRPTPRPAFVPTPEFRGRRAAEFQSRRASEFQGRRARATRARAAYRRERSDRETQAVGEDEVRSRCGRGLIGRGSSSLRVTVHGRSETKRASYYRSLGETAHHCDRTAPPPLPPHDAATTLDSHNHLDSQPLNATPSPGPTPPVGRRTPRRTSSRRRRSAGRWSR